MKELLNKIRPGYAGIVLGILFVIYGVSRGEVSHVLNKAINICLECIGLG